MLKQKLFIFNFFLAAFFLGLLGFVSCQIDSETKTLEVNPSSISTNQTDKTAVPASYIKHYTQKVLTDDNGEKYVSEKSEGFAYVESEDKSDNPIETGTKFKELAKDYEGFTFDAGFQKEKTVYLYYKRSTVEYSFYKDENTFLTKVPGTYGLKCSKPEAYIDGKPVITWKTKVDGTTSSFPETFGSKDAVFYADKTGIGTKVRPTSAGDIVFADGSAATLSQVKSASGEIKDTYKAHAIAVIIFITYNTYSGDTNNGNKMIGVGIQSLNDSEPEYTMKSTYTRPYRYKDEDKAEYTETFYSITNCGHDDLNILKKIYGTADFNERWMAFYFAEEYGNKIKTYLPAIKETISEEFLSGWYLPSYRELALLLATNYYYHTLFQDACTTILGEGQYKPDNDKFWASPSKTFDDETDTPRAAFLDAKSVYTKLSASDKSQWDIATATDSTYQDIVHQVLPFRIFE